MLSKRKKLPLSPEYFPLSIGNGSFPIIAVQKHILVYALWQVAFLYWRSAKEIDTGSASLT